MTTMKLTKNTKNKFSSKLIETDDFPFEFLSRIAENESWRKEIYRPIYYIHKWWARRLGSVFRGILLGSLLDKDSKIDFREAFYQRHDFSDVIVFDPFMGSGVTVGEAHKLGCISLGRDINPIACEIVRVSLSSLDKNKLVKYYNELEKSAAPEIKSLYKSKDEQGQICDVLYYFWVKYVWCPSCGQPVDLFPSYIVAQNAYPKRKPLIHVYCPKCKNIFVANYNEQVIKCSFCAFEFNPRVGNAKGNRAICSTCGKTFIILDAVRLAGQPPLHRMYAKLLLSPQGEKKYLSITDEDIHAYEMCSLRLQREKERGSIAIPTHPIYDGYNTRQVMNYGYRYWKEFFNDRQLLALSLLQKAITSIPDEEVRDAFLLLFSGILEFNNMFASYKGEGTGAVRHMFYHHILKPERVPIEANVWGTPKSSGSFSNLFESRLLRACDYQQDPFEISIEGNKRYCNCNHAFSERTCTDWPTNGTFEPYKIYISCGDSSWTGLHSGSVDLVITDPPFFNNVHYSELADFFYAWQSIYPHGFIRGKETTTRHPNEVQDVNPEAFSTKLTSVLAECNRVLKNDGLLVFTYHHSRVQGWLAIIKAIVLSGFSVVNSHPIKSELTVAVPKSLAKQPIQLDVIIVCVKRELDLREPKDPKSALDKAMEKYREKANRLQSIGLKLSQNDRLVIAASQFLSLLGPVDAISEDWMNSIAECLETLKKLVSNP